MTEHSHAGGRKKMSLAEYERRYGSPLAMGFSREQVARHQARFKPVTIQRAGSGHPGAAPAGGHAKLSTLAGHDRDREAAKLRALAAAHAGDRRQPPRPSAPAPAQRSAHPTPTVHAAPAARPAPTRPAPAPAHAPAAKPAAAHRTESKPAAAKPAATAPKAAQPKSAAHEPTPAATPVKAPTKAKAASAAKPAPAAKPKAAAPAKPKPAAPKTSTTAAKPKAAPKPKAATPAAAEDAKPIAGKDNVIAELGRNKTRYTENQKWAAQTYSSEAYQDINEELRAGRTPHDYADIVRDLDASFAKTKPLQNPITVMRGIDDDALSALFGSKPAVGKTMRDKAYVSTTADPMVAQSFSASGGGALLKIDLPKGARVLNMTEPSPPGLESDHPEESEALLPRGSKFKVVEDQVLHGKRVIRLQLVV